MALVDSCEYWLYPIGVARSPSFCVDRMTQEATVLEELPQDTAKGFPPSCVPCSLFGFSSLSKLLPLCLGW